MQAARALKATYDNQEELFVKNARKDILTFTRYTYRDYAINWHHRALAEKLNDWVEGRIKYLMVFMPPRHGKSELVSRRLPAYIHGRFPNTEIMAVSYLDSLAADMTVAVQDIIDSPAYKRVFPDTRIPPPRGIYTEGYRNTVGHTILGTTKGKYKGQGVNGSFTGKGANFIIIDDPIKGREIADSQAFRDRLWNFWLSDLYSRLETDLKSGRQGQVLLTLTRWHEDDLAGRLIDLMEKNDKALQWDILKYPAIKVNDDDPTDPRKIGEALWPEKYNLEQLEEARAQSMEGSGPRGWSSIYQQDPIPDGGGLFKDYMFEFCDPPGGYDYTFVVVDTAYEEEEENDYHCFTYFGYRSENDALYIDDVYMEKIQAVEAEEELRKFITPYVKWGYQATLIEPKGHGIYLNQKFRNEGIAIPDDDFIKEFFSDRKGDKVARANKAIPYLRRRKVYVNNRIPRKEEYVTQALRFPKSKYKDFVDTLVDGVKFAYARETTLMDAV